MLAAGQHVKRADRFRDFVRNAARWDHQMSDARGVAAEQDRAVSAEHRCELFHRQRGLACIVLRTSRFFPEQDDDKMARQMYGDENLKINEFLYRRTDMEDVVSAHMLAARKASAIGFDRLIISATTPFTPADRHDLRLQRSEESRSPLARAVGSKGYHSERFPDGPYPTE
jgi:hypothetical protein